MVAERRQFFLARQTRSVGGIAYPNRALTVHGVITEKHSSDHGNFIECDLTLQSAEGDRWVTGTATVRLPA